MADRPDTVDDLVTALLTASRALVGVSARSLAEIETSVTLTQFRMLVVLDGHGPSSLNHLADRLDVSPSTAARMVDRLIERRIVRRRENKANRREVVIDLTSEGQRIVDEVTGRRRASIESIVLAMPTRRRADLVEALQAFSEAADEPSPSADAATLLGW